MLLILASTSPYRRQLLERLGLPFEIFRPELEESQLPGEAPAAMSTRLAVAKAAAAKGRFQEGLVIGSDQVAACDGETLGKPGNHAAAVAQLQKLSGRTAVFYTSVALMDIGSGRTEVETAITRVHFRNLDLDTINAYLEREPAYDCAGSFKSEGLGITLIESMEEDDPSALVGLPLIRLCKLLRSFGVTP